MSPNHASTHSHGFEQMGFSVRCIPLLGKGAMHRRPNVSPASNYQSIKQCTKISGILENRYPGCMSKRFCWEGGRSAQNTLACVLELVVADRPAHAVRRSEAAGSVGSSSQCAVLWRSVRKLLRERFRSRDLWILYFPSFYVYTFILQINNTPARMYFSIIFLAYIPGMAYIIYIHITHQTKVNSADFFCNKERLYKTRNTKVIHCMQMFSIF